MVKCSNCGKDLTDVVIGQPCPRCGTPNYGGMTSQSSGGSVGSGTSGYEPIAARGTGGEQKVEAVAARGRGAEREEPVSIGRRIAGEEPRDPRTIPLTADNLAIARVRSLLNFSEEPVRLKAVRLFICDDAPPSEPSMADEAYSAGDHGSRNFRISRLGFRRDTICVPYSDLSKFYEIIREEGKDTVAESVAQVIDGPTWKTLTCGWITEDPGRYADAAQQVGDLQDAIHTLLLGRPTEELAFTLQVSGAPALGLAARQIPLGKIDDTLSSLKQGIEIIGIMVGVMTGNPVMTLTSIKALLHDEFHRVLAEGIKGFLFGSTPERGLRASDTTPFGSVEPRADRPWSPRDQGGWGMHGRG